MGITFKNSLPKITGDVKLEVATPTYSGKKSSDLNDSINPYTSAGPGAGGAGLTEEQINDIQNPSTSADPFFNDVVFVSSFDGTVGTSTFVDSSIKGKAITNNNTVQRSTGVTSKFGATSAFFNGTDQSLQLTGDADLDMTGIDYTVEMWAYPISGRFLMAIGDYVQGDDGIIFFYDLATTAGARYIQAGSTSNNLWQINKSSLINQWIHIALARESGITKMFVNGTQSGGDIITFQNNFPADGIITIGSGETNALSEVPGFWQQCYMQEVRITRNVARYTENFTVPTEPFPLS